MAVQAERLYSPQEYVEQEETAEYKSEYVAGEIYAMSGGTLEHGQLANSIGGDLRAQLQGRPCRVFNADVRIWTSGEHSCYPDASVLCGEAKRPEDDPNGYTNPVLVVEVLSRSTEAYDRGLKFRRYARLESLQEYVLVSQDRPWIERFLRMPSGEWAYAEAYGLDAALELQSIGGTLRLASVYDKVALPPEREAARPAAE